DPDRSAEPHHVLGSVRPNDAGPPLVLPPARVQFLCGPHRSSTPPIPTMTRKRPRTPSARALDLAAVPRSMWISTYLMVLATRDALRLPPERGQVVSALRSFPRPSVP